MRIKINGLQNIKFHFLMTLVYGFTIEINLRLNRRFVKVFTEKDGLKSMMYLLDFKTDITGMDSRKTDVAHVLVRILQVQSVWSLWTVVENVFLEDLLLTREVPQLINRHYVHHGLFGCSHSEIGISEPTDVYEQYKKKLH
jgi:hypothetical protein